MSLHTEEFFTTALPHRLDGSTVGDAFYAQAPDRGIRLRIDFYETRQHTYGGLRLSVIHPEKGRLDTAILSFADHGTYRARDLRTGTLPGTSGYATIRNFPHDETHRPWKGGDFATLADAVHRYARTWGIPLARPAARTAPRTTAPAATPSPAGGTTARAR
ncbi:MULTISPECIES: hypothetical protein [Streptomyces]|uniref:Uncharacterized protein n=1 Tax=Streptomyces tsukubensis (strain DSM 42081 / NBRC 108919 / NRRL 18488 / 9993) TaxID=1114943 RepID=I2N7U6_STRT9|nr:MULTISPECIES: hypothetical protein [Streptomyces]AZK97067.1 hypothetical protein B7R87_26745 [Streptomyces tsukubensis]EIF93093.1 hypothetical protein [Streptomyces tsukubensis NRRL18488]MYS66490.1 hypothetical protein [Streptomyces sp. SID5473]QKM66962.1 hypothetical protein STSU_007035 [Streptomyces tsukubensis NRRL18488]TAI41561.1 hypothetical protein EWI31_27415 [Streptomyces tsukubensis]